MNAPRRYRMRLAGTRLVSWYGCDFTGPYLDELDLGSERLDMLVGAAVHLAQDKSIPGDCLVR
jgi:hypothetical protein